MKTTFKYWIFLAIILVAISCGKDDPIEEVIEEGIVEQTKNETITAINGGEIETKTGVKIEVPATAITSDKNITVEIVDPTLEKNENIIPEGLKGEKISAVVRCGPEGTVFETPVKVTIPFYPELLHEQLTVDDIVVVSFSGDSLEQLPFTIDKANNVVVAEAMHFSDFAVVSNLFFYKGNNYRTTIINGVEWMAENFAYLPQVNMPTNLSYTEPRFFVLDYWGTNTKEAEATENFNKFGVIYNWQAALESCPNGWHLPTREEWRQLMDYINKQNGPFTSDSSSWGSHSWENLHRFLKDTTGWIRNGTNDYGFSALPGGHVGSNEVFSTVLGSNWDVASWWSSSKAPERGKEPNRAWSIDIQDWISDKNGQLFMYISFSDPGIRGGCSVRYIKDY